MIEISNLRKYTVGGGVRLEADINFTDMPSPYTEKTLYFEVDKAHGDMLADDTYDAFVLVPLYLAMYHKQDLHIRGNISKKFYQNIKWYVQKIWCDYWDKFSPVKFTVDGFTSAKRRGNLIGASISCGVDSLSTVYDHFVRESDPDYRINALFYFDCGILVHHGLDDMLLQQLAITRNEPGINAAKDLGLPCYYLKSNVKYFRKNEEITKFNHIAVYSCILSLSNAIFRYYVPSGASYEEMKIFRDAFHNGDMSEFCESYFIPLVRTERIELIVDGCQYRRIDKLKNIADWDIAQKYLNVCWRYTPDGSNCGVCPKCLRTQLSLEILGKLNKFSRVFNIEQYKRNSFGHKIKTLQNYGKEPFATENVDFARENNFPMPIKRDVFVLGNQAAVI